MKTIEIMTKAIRDSSGSERPDDWEDMAKAALQSIHEPDPNVVAAVADKLQMDAIKVAAVWVLMVEECLK